MGHCHLLQCEGIRHFHLLKCERIGHCHLLICEGLWDIATSLGVKE